MTHLNQHNELIVQNTQGDLFKVEIHKTYENFMLEVDLLAFDTDIETETITIDTLNETVLQGLEKEGYKTKGGNKQ